VAWREVLDFWSRLPAEAAYRRQRELATVLAARLQDIDRVELWSPHLPVGGIVTVSVAGYTASELFERLRDRKVIGRRVQKGAIQGVRLCTTFFNNLDDIGQAVDAVRALATLTSRASP
jgi:selenocysteine lyase/cysteine desulfurase